MKETVGHRIKKSAKRTKRGSKTSQKKAFLKHEVVIIDLLSQIRNTIEFEKHDNECLELLKKAMISEVKKI